MGTRGFISFVSNGEVKTGYNHSDSYPGGLGVDVLEWLRSTDLAVAAESAKSLRVVAPTSEPTDADIERMGRFHNPNVGGRSERPNWYQLLRETQGNPAAILEAGAVEDASGFPADSLFAEWGYVADFDGQMFECYRGFQEERHADGRFASETPNRSGYFPVRLAASWPFDSLPETDAFLARVEGDDSACPECGAELVTNTCTSGVCPGASCHECGYGCDLFTDGAGKCVTALRAKSPLVGGEA